MHELTDAASSCQDTIVRRHCVNVRRRVVCVTCCLCLFVLQEAPLHQWHYLEPFFHQSSFKAKLMSLLCCRGVSNFFQKTLPLEFELAANFVEAHNVAIPYIRGFFPAEELLCNIVVNEAQAELTLAERALEGILQSYQEVASAIQTRFALRAIVHEAETMNRKMLEDGHIGACAVLAWTNGCACVRAHVAVARAQTDQNEFDAINRCIEHSHKTCTVSVKKLSKTDLLRSLPYLRHLDAKTFDALASELGEVCRTAGCPMPRVTNVGGLRWRLCFVHSAEAV